MARIGYVLNAFPVVSETFILNEFRAVERAGIEIVIFSLEDPPPGPRHGALSEVSGCVIRAPVGPWAILRAHAWLAAHRPEGYRRALAEGLRSLRRDASSSARQEIHRFTRRFHRSVWVAEAARRHEVVHLHAHYAKEPLEVAAMVRRLAAIPYSFTAHAKDLYTSSARRLGRRLRKARFAVTCHSAGHMALAEATEPADRNKLLHVAHGIDTRIFNARRRRPQTGLMLAVGRLTPKKGLVNLVGACGLLRDRGVPFRCEIIGEGRLRTELRSAIDAAELSDRVRIRGFLPQEELQRRYRQAALVVSPAIRTADGNQDGLQNVVLEAMACGVPVVASRVGGIPEAIEHDRTGLLVTPGDVEALADALECLLSDPERAERLGAAASNELEKHDFRETVVPLVERFRAIVRPPVESRLRATALRTWSSGGLAERAAKELGRPPVHDPGVEEAIQLRVLPGIRANAWRPDLERIVERRLWDEYFKARRLGRLESALGGSLPDARALDLGCGRGGLSVALRARGTSVVSFDLRHRNCEITRSRAKRYQLDVSTSVGRGEQLPFADGSFDVVCCLEVTEHTQDPETLLREIHRTLSPDGACALTIVNRFAHRDPHYHLWGVNFLPRSWAMRYVSLRGRSKSSSGDRQSLDDMHYFRFRKFVRLAGALGFEVDDPERPRNFWPALRHRLKRDTSLGFNDAFLILRVRD